MNTSGGAVDKARNTAELVVVMLTSGLMAAIFMVPAPILYRIEGEYGPWIAQGIANVPAIGIVIAGPLTGRLFGRFGTRAVLLPALALFGLSGIVITFVTNPVLMLVSRLIVGITSAAAVAASIAVISGRFEEPLRMRLIGIQGGLGSAIGLVMLWAAGQLGASGTWRSPFWLYSLGILLFLIAMLASGAHGTPQSVPSQRSEANPASLWRQWPLFLLTIVLYCASFSGALQLSFKLGEHGIVDPRVQSYVMLPSTLVNAVASAAYGFVLTMIGSYSTYILLIALMAVGAAVIGVGTDPLTIAIGASLMGIGGGLLGPNLIGRLMNRVGAAERAGAVGLLYSCIFIGQFLNPFLMQPLRSALKADGAFMTLGILLGIAAAVAAVTTRRQLSPMGA